MANNAERVTAALREAKQALDKALKAGTPEQQDRIFPELLMAVELIRKAESKLK